MDFDENQTKIAAVLCILCENATRDAIRVASYRGDDFLQQDVVHALMRQVVPSSGFFAQPNLAVRAQGHYDALCGRPGDAQPPQEEEVPVADLVRHMATVEAEFTAWVPDSQEGRYLKAAIEKTAATFLRG